MTVLARARAASYEVGTNLRGSGLGATWTLLLPSLAIDAAAVAGKVPPGDLDALDRLSGARFDADGTDPLGQLGDRRLDLILLGRGGAASRGGDTALRALAERLSTSGAAYGEVGALPEWWSGAVQPLTLWPAVGPARVFVPSGNPETVERLARLGFLPPRGSASLRDRVLNRAAGMRAPGHRSRRRAVLGLGPGSASLGPPAYVVEIARAAGVEIQAAPWALVAPGDYASQKVLLLLFDPADGQPWIVVKLGADPAYAERLRNEAAALAQLAGFALPDGTVPVLRFAGEHAARGVVGQVWLRGRPFTEVSEPSAEGPQLEAAASWLTSLAAASVQRREAGEVGEALRDLFDRYRSVHDPSTEEADFLDEQVRAVERQAGTLPVVFQHGDPGAWNLMIDDDGRIAFLDWESAEAHGLPLWDLVHFQFSFGAWVSRRDGERRRLDAAIRHFVTPGALQARFADQISELAGAVGLPPPMIRPLFYTCWMQRSLKEATRRTPATLNRGLYVRMLREMIRRREDPKLRRLLGSER